MKTLLVLVFISVLTCPQSRAEDSVGPLSSLLTSQLNMLLARLDGSTECAPPPFEDLAALPPKKLIVLFKSSAASGDHCQAYMAAYELMNRPSIQGQGDAMKWLTAEVKELIAAKDYRKSIVQSLHGLTDLELDKSSAQAVPVRLMILRAVFAAAKALGKDHDPQWIHLSLGLQASPLEDAPLLSYDQFVSDYPNSNAIPEVRSMHKATVDLLIDWELDCASHLLKIEQFMGAISHLEYLYTVPECQDSARLPEVIVETIHVELEFIHRIETDSIVMWSAKRWDDQRLREVFHDYFDKTHKPFSRGAVVVYLQERIQKARASLNILDHSGVYRRKADDLISARSTQSPQHPDGRIHTPIEF